MTDQGEARALSPFCICSKIDMFARFAEALQGLLTNEHGDSPMSDTYSKRWKQKSRLMRFSNFQPRSMPINRISDQHSLSCRRGHIPQVSRLQPLGWMEEVEVAAESRHHGDFAYIDSYIRRTPDFWILRHARKTRMIDSRSRECSLCRCSRQLRSKSFDKCRRTCRLATPEISRLFCCGFHSLDFQ